jgi:hypothetical protein
MGPSDSLVPVDLGSFSLAATYLKADGSFFAGPYCSSARPRRGRRPLARVVCGDGYRLPVAPDSLEER